MISHECPCCHQEMSEDEVLWSDLYECAVSFWFCPMCGYEEQEILE